MFRIQFVWHWRINLSSIYSDDVKNTCQSRSKTLKPNSLLSCNKIELMSERINDVISAFVYHLIYCYFQIKCSDFVSCDVNKCECISNQSIRFGALFCRILISLLFINVPNANHLSHSYRLSFEQWLFSSRLNLIVWILNIASMMH